MGEVASAGHAAKAAGYEALDVTVDYLIPIAAGIAGFVGGPALLGGTYTLANAINNGITSAGQTPGAIGTRVGGFVMGGIFAIIGMAFWRLGKHDGWVMRIIGKSVGGFMLGTAAATVVISGIGNQPAPQNGALDQLFTFIQQVSKGG